MFFGVDDQQQNLVSYSLASIMSQKRQPDDGNSPEKKRQKFRNVILEAVKMDIIQKFLSGLEPLVRRVVKEEVEVALKKHLSKKQNGGNQVHPSTSRSLQLKFRNKLSLPVFTGSKIEGEEGSIIDVALVDSLTGEVVSSGPESSVKVEIVVLEGDFEGGEDDDWSHEEFNNNIVKEREGKRPLLTGDSILNLKEGTSMLGELYFTDNSSWTRSRKFKLGARIVDDNNDGVRAREAKTEAFMVKDHRGELYKKHYPPSLVDEVWRLEKIGKDGAFHKRLSKENINTVKDFLTLLVVDALRLRNILGTGMSAKMWEVTVEHAQTCTLDDNRMYVYYPSSTQQKMGVVFDVVGHILGVLTEEQYITIDKLSETERVNANNLVKLAHDHWEEVISFDAASIMDGSSHFPGTCFPSSSTTVGSSYADQLPSSHISDELGFAQSSGTPSSIVSSIISEGGTRSLHNISVQDYDMDRRYEQLSSFTDQVTDSLSCDAEAIVQSFCSEDHMPYFVSDFDLHTAVSSFPPTPTQSSANARPDKAHTGWTVLCSVLKWRSSIRKLLALKRTGGWKMRYS